ncbi:MAG: DNA polymerase/3'-5' exonuclease PolX [Candidatus Woesearchaeota archaeon]
MKTNKNIAKLFDEMAILLELEGVEWKPQAYRKASRNINNYYMDINEVYKKKGIKGLQKIKGVGENISKHIEEYLKTNQIKKLKDMRKKYPKEIMDISTLEGLGPKKIRFLLRKLNIKSKKDLENAVKNKQIRNLEGFGEVTEKNIQQSLNLHKKKKGRMLLDQATRICNEIINYLKKETNIKTINYAGSIRRMKETIGDIDILAIKINADKLINAFTNFKDIKKVISKGQTKSSIILNEDNIQVDLRIIPKESYIAALQYFTGSKAHNIELRKIALSEGYKLSEYGLFKKKDNKKISLKNEKELYKKLGLQYIPPEIRENRGEIELAKNNKIPKLIRHSDIKGDLHIHTTYSDGLDTIKDIVDNAKKKGYRYIAITDHSKSRKIAGGLSEKKLKEQWKEIDKIKKNISIEVLKGAEVDILKDGKLDYSDKILKKLDFVIGSIHQNFKMPKKDMTKRIIKALKNENLHALGHLTGRMIKKREPYNADYNKIFQVAADNNKLIEINSQPQRLDLNDDFIYRAKKKGVKFIINTDSHTKSNLNFIRFGIGQARRGQLKKSDVVNTKSFSQLKKVLKNEV